MTSQKLLKLIKEDNQYLFQNYGDRLPVCFIKGDGDYLFDQDNKKYIDLFSGIAVCSLGYSNPRLSKILHDQTDKIIHSSNWFLNAEQIKAAKLISELSFPGKTLFVNSGTEANEAAIKLARRYGESLESKPYQIISFKGSFHGRTFGSLSATGQEKIRKGFGPILSGFKYLPLNKIDAFKKEIGKKNRSCAVITELIQGEGGINLADKEFIIQVFDICKKNNILFIVDEVQTGIGRTGKLFAYQHYNITPDIITLAKGLGGGIPVGAVHARDEIAKFLNKGVHGTTFGGNHLSSAAVIAVLTELKKDKILNNIEKISCYIFSQLNKLKEEVDFIVDVRGIGLHIGIELNHPGIDIVKKALQRGLVINCTVDKVIRIMPPLTISLNTVKEGLNILRSIFLEEQSFQ
ncbi:MAG: aspartate aminotransferase family protein [Spirochaetota bacterium]|nr:aspartate aminotransferase family protein [Spirochaetota bacterium]